MSLPNIQSDERDQEPMLGVCMDCGKTKPIRRVNQVDFITGENRGWFGEVCFDCRKPIIKWITLDGRPMESSVANSFNLDGTRKV